MTALRITAPDYILDASAVVLRQMLPLFERTPGGVADPALYARYRSDVRRLIGDTRAAARREDLADRIAAIADGYRLASDNPRAVITGLERVAVRARAVTVTVSQPGVLALQRANELALLILFEGLALAGVAHAVANLTPRSYDEARTLRLRLGRLFDVAIERASDQGAVSIQRALRAAQAKIVRDLIERGRPLARVVPFETATPLPAVVLAHRFYQSAGRAGELRDENSATDHPAFMPMAGRAYSR